MKVCYFNVGNKVSICADRGNTLRRGNEFAENRRGEPRKVDKSNGIEIQINAALNDAYRIPRPWKGRKRERKDPVTSRWKECRKETTDDVRGIQVNRFCIESSTNHLETPFNRHWFDTWNFICGSNGFLLASEPRKKVFFLNWFTTIS